jgi:hypothetical protein
MRKIAEGGARESDPFRLPLIGYLPAVGSAFAAVTATGCPAAETSVLPGTGLIDVERPSVQFFSVESGDGPEGFIIVAHFDESEPAGLPGVTIGDDTYTFNRSELLK